MTIGLPSLGGCRSKSLLLEGNHGLNVISGSNELEMHCLGLSYRETAVFAYFFPKGGGGVWYWESWVGLHASLTGVTQLPLFMALLFPYTKLGTEPIATVDVVFSIYSPLPRVLLPYRRTHVVGATKPTCQRIRMRWRTRRGIPDSSRPDALMDCPGCVPRQGCKKPASVHAKASCPFACQLVEALNVEQSTKKGVAKYRSFKKSDTWLVMASTLFTDSMRIVEAGLAGSSDD